MAVLKRIFTPEEISLIKKQGAHATRRCSVGALTGRSVYIYGCGLIGREVYTPKWQVTGVTVSGFVDRHGQGLVDRLPVFGLEALRTAAPLPPLVIIVGRYARDRLPAAVRALREFFHGSFQGLK